MLKAKRLFDTLEPKTLIGQRARQKKKKSFYSVITGDKISNSTMDFPCDSELIRLVSVFLIMKFIQPVKHGSNIVFPVI